MEIAKIKIIDTASNHIVSEQFTQQSAPTLSWNGSDENFQTIMASEFNFNMLSEGAADGKFYDLFTGDESKYRVVIEDELNRVFWQGFLQPDEYSEPYTNGSFFVNFNATDGLGLLKNKPFSFYEYDVQLSVIKIIATILKQTNLYQSIYVAEALQMTTLPFCNVLLNTANFRGEPELDFLVDNTEYDSCYEVLEKILSTMGCTLFTAQGSWYVVGWNRKHLIQDSYKVYDFHGNFKEDTSLVKNITQGLFDDDLKVLVNAPLQSVELAYDLEEDGKVITDKFYYKASGDGGLNPLPMPGLNDDTNPLDYWNANTGLQLSLGNANGERVIETADIAVMYETKPWCLKFNVLPSQVANANKYVSLKSQHIKYIEKKEFSVVLIDLDVELFSLPSSNVSEKVDEGFYDETFRIDVFVGGNLVFTTRADNALFEENFKIRYTDINEPAIIPGGLSTKKKQSLRKVSATLKTSFYSQYEGELNVRVYQPKFLPGRSVDWNDVHVAKFNLEVKTKSKTKVYNNRNINYSTLRKIDLPFYSSKSDLTKKGFRKSVSEFLWLSSIENIPLFNRQEDEEFISFEMSLSDANWLRKNLRWAKISKGNQEYFVQDVFGELNYLNGFYLMDGIYTSRLYFGKAKISQLFYLWNPFDGFVLKTYKSNPISLRLIENRNSWLKWKRFGSVREIDYGVAYGRMMLDCVSSPFAKLDGNLKKIITPLDLIRFNWIEDRVFWVSRLSVDFAAGKSKVNLCETKFEIINDGNII